MIVCNIKVEAPRKAMTPSGRKLLKVPWTPDYILIFHNYVYSLGYILSVSGHQKLRPDPARRPTILTRPDDISGTDAPSDRASYEARKSGHY